MKLYATTTSERASKGQGGNEYLEIEIKIIDKINPKYYVRVNNNTFEVLDSEERVLFIEEHTKARCSRCKEFHDVEDETRATGTGHDLIQVNKIYECEKAEFPDDEFFQEEKGNKQKDEVCIHNSTHMTHDGVLCADCGAKL